MERKQLAVLNGMTLQVLGPGLDHKPEAACLDVNAAGQGYGIMGNNTFRQINFMIQHILFFLFHQNVLPGLGAIGVEKILHFQRIIKPFQEGCRTLGQGHKV